MHPLSYLLSVQYDRYSAAYAGARYCIGYSIRGPARRVNGLRYSVVHILLQPAEYMVKVKP